MGMTALGLRLPQIAERETRTLTVYGREDLPDGEYGFVELYCEDEKCDCQRVLIWVVSLATGSKIWATINFGWESIEFYARWTRNRELALQMSGAHLDPINPQSEYANVLLDYFVKMVADEEYVERLKRHYYQFRAATPIRSKVKAPNWRPAARLKRRLR